MIYNATKAIAEAFKAAELKYRVSEGEERSSVDIGFNAKNVSDIEIKFISRDDDADVAVRLFSLAKVPEDKVTAMMPVINKLNSEYRYIKFYIDEDNEVTLCYDFPLNTEDIGAVALESLHRTVQIADDAYPTIMKALWA